MFSPVQIEKTVWHLTTTEWTAVATVVNAGAVLVLVGVTWAYARSAKRQADASEKQAAVMKDGQEVLLQQLKTQDRTAWLFIKNVTASAMVTVEEWIVQLKPGHFPRVPEELGLRPPGWQEATKEAHRLVPELGDELAAAFDLLGRAETQLGIVRNGNPAFQTWVGPSQLATLYLTDAQTRFAKAKALLEAHSIA